ncbi:MAG: EAL domain-containing response regulator [Alphaproteobacteria bacterium]|jgi:EAL domain-containing protein (putative c-di-GMP-specific phosphodiesterase class I)/FixJ family two-component response regulator|nr:EAL domain-containing response regulator [Alphaproteobacteria bacterium]MBT4083283.1 EAL domain-containing response regulator [Alphaproteobacteria bacterium]MBT4545055.1 EAL domain-containing response regulator [Alphaproteobacteria bacterium]
MQNDTGSGLGELNFHVVDDEVFIRKLIIRVLGKMGADSEKISSSENGADAIAWLDDTTQPPDIILCDLNMPDMDGVSLMRHLATRKYRGGIILVSGEDKRILKAAEDLARAHDLNFLGALAKPVTPDALESLIKLYDPLASQRTEREGVELTADDLKTAIENKDIFVVFQPQVSVTTRELIGVETLARWIHADKGFIPPDIFVHLAEEKGLIDDLTELVVDLAVTQGGEWLADGLDVKISVNISVDNLNNLKMPEYLGTKCEEAGMDSRSLVLEVTESRLMEDIVTPLEILTRLRLKGHDLSIDDFGTGHASMEQLKRIPFSELKIDRAFVNGAHRDAGAMAILKASVDLAKSMDMLIVAEGVEDQDDWDLVAKLGCDIVQGYFSAKPMPAGDIKVWLQGWLA